MTMIRKDIQKATLANVMRRRIKDECRDYFRASAEKKAMQMENAMPLRNEPRGVSTDSFKSNHEAAAIVECRREANKEKDEFEGRIGLMAGHPHLKGGNVCSSPKQKKKEGDAKNGLKLLGRTVEEQHDSSDNDSNKQKKKECGAEAGLKSLGRTAEEEHNSSDNDSNIPPPLRRQYDCSSSSDEDSDVPPPLHRHQQDCSSNRSNSSCSSLSDSSLSESSSLPPLEPSHFDDESSD